MPICARCGIEIQEGETRCPLCLAPLAGIASTGGKDGPPASPPAPDPDGRKMIWLWEALTFLAAGGMVIVFAIDFAYGKAVTWARYPLASIAYGWTALSLALHLKRRMIPLLFGEAAALALYLWSMDGFTPGRPWFFPLALPVVLIFFFLLGAAVAAVRLLKLSGAGMLAAGIAAAGIFMLCLEVLINRFTMRPVLVSWSAVAFACIITFIGLLAYFQKRLRKNAPHLKKVFHV
jgi:hypothetical protein